MSIAIFPLIRAKRAGCELDDQCENFDMIPTFSHGMNVRYIQSCAVVKHFFSRLRVEDGGQPVEIVFA